jgi:hypothetical protein
VAYFNSHVSSSNDDEEKQNGQKRAYFRHLFGDFRFSLRKTKRKRGSLAAIIIRLLARQ